MSKGVQVQDLRSFQAACKSLHDEVVGQRKIIQTPFGRRRLLYCDYTASGRAVQTIEDYVQSEVLPVYANIHSMESTSARQSSFFREEARDICRNYLNATHEDTLLFAGNGFTGACERLVSVLRQCDWHVGSRGGESGIVETRWHSYVCKVCDLQLDNESAAKSHLRSSHHLSRSGRDTETCKLRMNAFLIDPTSHHSAFLPFKEQQDYHSRDTHIKFMSSFIATDTRTGHLDIQSLINILAGLAEIKSRLPPSVELNIFVLISACSNVTGLKIPVAKVADILHSFKALAVWDMASALGHLKIDLNPPDHPNAYLDVTIMSPHKLLGGPATAGLLTFKKFLFQNDVPGLPGGGSVRFVSKETQLYSLNSSDREEAGTPNIIACIRTGLTFRLSSLISQSLVVAREIEFMDFLLSSWSKKKQIHILGPLAVPDLTGASSRDEIESRLASASSCLFVRKAVVSFVVKYGNKTEEETAAEPAMTKVGDLKTYSNRQTRGGLFLHHNFVCALLNDIFGIQARPGCACAGPLSQSLLGFDESLTRDLATCLEETGADVFRPGFVRLSLHYSMDWDEIELLAAAVNWIASWGWKLLPFYTFQADTGIWTQNVLKPKKFRKWLSTMHFDTLADRSVKLSCNEEILKEQGGDASTQTSVKRDPRKLAGAVCLPGMGGAMDELKNTLASKRANLKKAGTAQQRQPPLSEKAAPKSATGETLEPLQGTPAVQRADSQPTARRQSLSHNKATDATHSVIKTVDKRGGDGKTDRDTKKGGDGKTGGDGKSGVETRKGMPVVKNDGDLKTIGVALRGSKSVSSEKAAELNRREIENSKEESKTDEDVLDPELIYRMTNGSDEVPEELGEFYNVANRLIDAITSTRSGSEVEQARRLANLNKRGLSPPLPAKWAHLLWFALPGDAALSLKLFEPARGKKGGEEAVPLVAMKPEDVGYPRWYGDGVPQRAVDSPFEVIRFSPMSAPTLTETYTPVITKDETLRLWAAFNVVKSSEKSKAPSPNDSGRETSKTRDVSGPLVLTAKVETASLETKVEVEPKEDLLLSQLCAQTTAADTYRDNTSDTAAQEGDGDAALSSDVASLSSNEKRFLRDQGRLEIPKIIRKTVGKAIDQFKMILPGDKILVGLSGGKDSLTLLHVLRDLQLRSPVKFELGAATVNPLTSEYDPTPLVPYVESLGIEYHLLTYPIIELAKEKMQGDSLCSFCARLKRGLLTSCMKAHGYTALALGQHLDDICESFLMSAFYNGSLNTMKANYVPGDTQLRVIRPLILTREADLASFAANNRLPVIVDNCPACFAAPKERLRMKHLLAQQEYEFPNTVGSLAKALNPLMGVDRVDKKFRIAESESSPCEGMCPLERTGRAFRSETSRR